MKSIDVCLTPDLLHLHNIDNTIVVVTDIFRATSCMVTGLAYGVGSITPVATVEECFELQQKGYIAAAERNAMKVEGFDLDNSPFSYMDEDLIGANIAMTTTNGTLSITKAKTSAVKVLVGAFLNLGAIVTTLNRSLTTYSCCVRAGKVGSIWKIPCLQVRWSMPSKTNTLSEKIVP